MQAACHEKSGTIIADYNPDHGGSSEQTERRKSFGLFISHPHQLRHRDNFLRFIVFQSCQIRLHDAMRGT